jgi:hypothetical protein
MNHVSKKFRNVNSKYHGIITGGLYNHIMRYLFFRLLIYKMN